MTLFGESERITKKSSQVLCKIHTQTRECCDVFFTETLQQDFVALARRCVQALSCLATENVKKKNHNWQGLQYILATDEAFLNCPLSKFGERYRESSGNLMKQEHSID